MASAWPFPPEPPSLLRSGRWVQAPTSCRVSVPTPHLVLGQESQGGVRDGCIPCGDEPALEPGLLKPLSGRWVSWNSCRLRSQRPPKLRCSRFPGCSYSAERLEVALGRAGRKCTVSSQGPSSRGPPPIQEAVRCKLAQVWELTEGRDWGAGRNGDRDTGTSEVMGTALLWTVRVGS